MAIKYKLDIGARICAVLYSYCVDIPTKSVQQAFCLRLKSLHRSVIDAMTEYMKKTIAVALFPRSEERADQRSAVGVSLRVACLTKRLRNKNHSPPFNNHEKMVNPLYHVIMHYHHFRAKQTISAAYCLL